MSVLGSPDLEKDFLNVCPLEKNYSIHTKFATIISTRPLHVDAQEGFWIFLTQSLFVKKID